LPLYWLQEGVDFLKLIIPLGTEELFKYFEEIYISGMIHLFDVSSTKHTNFNGLTFYSDVSSRNMAECSPGNI